MLLNNFSDRLKEERTKLSLSQAELGELCGVKKLAQFNYEKGERFPDAAYLMQATKVGIDVNYLLTGKRSAGVLPADETLILEKYRQADAGTKNKMLMLLLGGNVATSGVIISNSGTVQGGQNHATNQTINNAPSTSSKTNIKVGKQKGDIVNGDKHVTK